MVVVADLALLLALFMSTNLALAWAEVATFPPHGDKSALAGVAGVLVLMVGRWSALAGALGLAAARGGFAGLPGGRGAQGALVLLAHAALGVQSYRGFEWLVAAVQRDDPGPLALWGVFGLVLPLPAFAAAFYGLHRGWAGRHPVLAVLLVPGFGWAHLAGWRAGYRAPASASVTTESRD